MKKLLLFLFSFFTVAGYAQTNYGFDKIYNFSGNDSFVASNIMSAYADTDRYFVCGNTMTPSVSTLHGFLATFDYSGNPIWTQKLFFPGKYNAFWGNDCITKFGFDKYLLAGNIYDLNINPYLTIYQPYLYIFKANGDSILCRNYTDTFQDHIFRSVTIDENKNIIGAGIVTSYSLGYDQQQHKYYHDSNYVWVVKYDSIGNRIWERSIFPKSNWGTNPTNVNKVVVSDDKQHYAVTGMRDIPFVMKFDTAGNLLWEKGLPVGYNCELLSTDIITAPGGGYYFASAYSRYPYSQNPNAPGYVATLYGKLNENGDTVWTRTFNRNAPFVCMSRGVRIGIDNQKNLVVSLQSRVPGNVGTEDSVYYDHPALIKTDSLGNVLWYRELQRINHYRPEQQLLNLSVTPQNKILMTGRLWTALDTTFSWMVLTDSMGMRYAGDTLLDSPFPLIIPQTNTAVLDVTVFPNPVYQTLYIKNEIAGKLKMEITTIDGKLLMTKELNGATQEQINMQPLLPGLYMVKLFKDGLCIKTYKVSHL